MEGHYQYVSDIKRINKEICNKKKHLNKLKYIDTSFLEQEISSLERERTELINSLNKLDVKNRR